VRRALHELEEAGVDQVIILIRAAYMNEQSSCESLQLLGEEVIPEFVTA